MPFFSQTSPVHKKIWGTERVICKINNTHILKFIQTLQPTSVQVHPRSPDILPEQDGEIWCVFKKQPKSALYLGFSRETNRREIFHAIQDGTITSLMRCYRPLVGDCFWVPAGMIHCLGPGLMVLEIRPSESPTWRLYDWNRQTGRTLHLEAGLNEIEKQINIQTMRFENYSIVS